MKLLISFSVFLLFLIMLASPSVAQRPIALGINAGVNISTQDFEIRSDTGRTTRKGLLITGQTDWPLVGPAVLQDRLSYIEKGVKVQHSVLLGSETVTSELNYIELSLAPKVRFGLHEFKPYLFLGPRLGLLVSGNVISQQGSFSRSEPAKNYYHSWDFGFDAGAGFAYPVVSRLYFLADASYGVGLTNIVKNTVAGNGSAFSRDLKLQAGILLEAFPIE